MWGFYECKLDQSWQKSVEKNSRNYPKWWEKCWNIETGQFIIQIFIHKKIQLFRNSKQVSRIYTSSCSSRMKITQTLFILKLNSSVLVTGFWLFYTCVRFFWPLYMSVWNSTFSCVTCKMHAWWKFHLLAEISVSYTDLFMMNSCSQFNICKNNIA